MFHVEHSLLTFVEHFLKRYSEMFHVEHFLPGKSREKHEI